MKILIVFFSYTGNTRKVALDIANNISDDHVVEIEEIRSHKEHKYIFWLLSSFIPGRCSKIQDIHKDLRTYDIVCFGFPKWTFSCPPFNQYLKEVVGLKYPRLGVFITYGGFDVERYYSSLLRKIENKGGNISSKIILRRSEVSIGNYQEKIKKFYRRLLDESD